MSGHVPCFVYCYMLQDSLRAATASENFLRIHNHYAHTSNKYFILLNTLSQVPLHLSTPLSRLCCSTLPLIPITASCEGAALILSSCTPIRLRKLLWDVHVSHAAESAINGNILCQPGGLSCWPKSSAHDEIYGDVHRQEGHCRQETCLND